MIIAMVTATMIVMSTMRVIRTCRRRARARERAGVMRTTPRRACQVSARAPAGWHVVLIVAQRPRVRLVVAGLPTSRSGSSPTPATS